MAIATVVTRGYGNGTFSGTIALIITRGYTIGAAVVFDTDPDRTVTIFAESRTTVIIEESRTVSPKPT